LLQSTFLFTFHPTFLLLYIVLLESTLLRIYRFSKFTISSKFGLMYVTMALYRLFTVWPLFVLQLCWH